MKKLEHFSHQLLFPVVHKVCAIEFTPEELRNLVQENIYKTVISGMPRMLVLLACIAGTTCRMRTGTSAAAIKTQGRGGEFFKCSVAERRKRGELPLY